MKQTIITLVALLMFQVSNVNAQERKDNNNRLQHQTANLVNMLQLDDKGAAKFTETYGRYKKEMMGVMTEGRVNNAKEANKNGKQQARPANGRKQLTDAEIEKRILDGFSRSKKILEIRERYYKEFRSFLTPRQIEKIYSLERDGMQNLNPRNHRQVGKQPNRPGMKPGMKPGMRPQQARK